MAETFRVLFVCTGNICRSPMAQAMLTHALRERLGDASDVIEVASAGTGALVGEPMEPFAVEALARLGITPAAFVARDMAVDMLDATELVLTATRQHRALVVTMQPAVVRRTFTIKEFARLASSLDDAAASDSAAGPLLDRLRAAVVRVAAQRGVAAPVPAGEDDIGDPYRLPAERFRQTAAELSSAIDVIAAILARAAAA